MEEGWRLLGLSPNLSSRIVSTIVIVPPVILLIVLGGTVFGLFVAAVAGRAMWEWARMVTRRPASHAGIHSGILVAVSVGAAALDWPVLATVVLATGVLVFLTAAMARRLARGAWLSLGLVVIAVPSVSLLVVRGTDADGLATTLWVVASVVASDVGAYMAGKMIGGAKLAPRISPNKTWSGCIGGLVAAALVGAAAALILESPNSLGVMAMAAGFGVLAQFGDLVESALKRRFEVKDSGSLIPGHGGLLDRLDGHLAAMPVAAVLTLLVGHSLLVL